MSMRKALGKGIAVMAFASMPRGFAVEIVSFD